MKITLCFKIKYNKSKRILFKKLRTNPLYCPDYCIYRPAIITQLNDSCLFMMGHKTDKTVYIGKTLKLEILTRASFETIPLLMNFSNIVNKLRIYL